MIELLLGCICVHLFIIGTYLRKIAQSLEQTAEDDEEDAE